MKDRMKGENEIMPGKKIPPTLVFCFILVVFSLSRPLLEETAYAFNQQNLSRIVLVWEQEGSGELNQENDELSLPIINLYP